MIPALLHDLGALIADTWLYLAFAALGSISTIAYLDWPTREQIEAGR